MKLSRHVLPLILAGANPTSAQSPPQPRPAATLAPGNHTFSLRHAGRSRSYIVHVPKTATNAKLPLIVAVHGGGGEAAGFQEYAGLDSIADREGFLVAYPNGNGVLPRRLLTWNAGDCCGYAMNNKIDDVGFAIAVIDDIAKRIGVDSSRVYATGHSNGAMMSYRLGAERADRIAAIVPVAGAYDMASFAPSRPVAVMHIHSIDDPRALYTGGTGPPFPGTNVRSAHRSVMEGLEKWRKHNGCADSTTIAERRMHTVEGGEKQSAERIVWRGCRAPVVHWKLTGVGHGWPGAQRSGFGEEIIGPSTTMLRAGEEIWKFVKDVRR
jgi:polyhydroxybutyrate depolymerase